MSIQSDSEVAANVPVGGTDRSALFYDSVAHVWKTKDQAGTIGNLGGVTGVSNSDGTLTISPTVGAVVASRAAITGGVTVNAGSNTATVVTNANLTGPVTSTGNATAIANGAISNAMLANAAVANLSGTNTGDQTITLTGAVTGSGTGSFATTLANALIINPKNIEGVAYVDPTNTQGWAGSDAGAWINSAYAYLKTTYGSNGAGGPTFGGVIQLAPGLYTYTTPIVLETQYFTIILRGCGDGATTSNSNGGSMLSYTPTTGIALNIGGASNNTGGVQVENLNLQGAGLGNATTGIKWGLLGASSTAGATIKNVAIQGFGKGEDWETNTNIAYAVSHFNVKIQFCGVGITPFGEANNFFGGLIGGCTTGVAGTNAGTDMMMFGVAFDDNTTVALNVTSATFRATLSGCRFENAGGGTDLYITQTNGSIIIDAGSMQSDITTGTSTGFANLSGGNFTLSNTWLLGQGSRVFTQAFNVSGSVIARIKPTISLASVGITTIMQTGFTDKGILNQLTANVAVAITTETLIMNARIPANAATVGQVYRWKCVAVTTGANTVTWRIRNGAGGVVGDATIANVVVTAAGVANGRSTYEGFFTIRTIGGAGTAQAEGTAITATSVASTTAAAPATTAVVTNAAWFIDITMANGVAAATVVSAYIEAL